MIYVYYDNMTDMDKKLAMVLCGGVRCRVGRAEPGNDIFNLDSSVEEKESSVVLGRVCFFIQLDLVNGVP